MEDKPMQRPPAEEGPVDGFSDTAGPTDLGSPDPMPKLLIPPLSPAEFAKAQKEARESDDQEDEKSDHNAGEHHRAAEPIQPEQHLRD